MLRSRALSVVIVVALLLSSASTIPVSIANAYTYDELDNDVGTLIKKINTVKKDEYNVSKVIYELNIILINDTISIDEKLRRINEISYDVDSATTTEGAGEIMGELMRLVLGFLVLLIPLITYYLLPRIYALIWYKIHKNWIIEEVAE